MLLSSWRLASGGMQWIGRAARIAKTELSDAELWVARCETRPWILTLLTWHAGEYFQILQQRYKEERVMGFELSAIITLQAMCSDITILVVTWYLAQNIYVECYTNICYQIDQKFQQRQKLFSPCMRAKFQKIFFSLITRTLTTRYLISEILYGHMMDQL